ncbi:MAG: T9SS C-terminal target domain-containing protein [Candidatus Zixiibacteriota bacterium]|nr:MAG: T9SS C-terminal target domain-containing protein [candidate division Zixibacteria bacterium]
MPGNLRGSVGIEVGELSVDGETWHFMEDSTALSRGVFMQSEPLTVTATTNNVLLRYAATVEDFQKPGNGVPNVPLLRLRLVDADNGKILRRVANVRLKDLRNGNWRRDDTLSIDLSAFRGKTVVLQMQTVRHFLDNSGSADYVNIYRFDDPVNTQPLAKHTVELLPERFALHQNYPNPFNPATTLAFDLPAPSDVRLAVYDLQGRLVKTVAAGRYEAGRHSAVWDGSDAAGVPVSSGVYFYRLTVQNGAAPFVQTRKMLLLR